MQSNGTSAMDSNHANEQARQQRAEDSFWQTAGTLWNWRRFIAGVTGSVAVAAVIISLLLPNWYRAETRLLLPSGGNNNGFLSAAISESGLSSAASSLLGGTSGDYLRYLSILSSRSMLSNAVDTFDLVQVYQTADNEAPHEDALELLRSNTELIVDQEYDYLSVQVLDRNPQRAADMANYLVRSLEDINNELASRSATRYREFVEQRYFESEAKLDSVMDELRAFQEEHGVLNLEEQAPSFFESLAEMRLSAIRADIEYKRLQSEYGDGNPIVRSAREAVRAANQTYENALEGGEAMMPIAKSEMPGVARAFFDLEKERRIQARIIEFMRPMYEQARMDEQRETEAVQVVDEAIPPAKKDSPRRSIICVVATLSALLLACMFVLAYTWWRRNHAYYSRRLQTAASDSKRASPREHVEA